MKKLILTFLYFVGFALVLIQCAKMFPSETKLFVRPITLKHNVVNSPAKHGKLVATITGVSVAETN